MHRSLRRTYSDIECTHIYIQACVFCERVCDILKINKHNIVLNSVVAYHYTVSGVTEFFSFDVFVVDV